MKNFIYFTILAFFSVDVFAQSNIEKQIENNQAFEHNVMREAVTVFSNNDEKALKDGVLEIKKPQKSKIIVINDNNNTEDVSDWVVQKPIMNKSGPYLSFLLNASLSGGYDEVWATNSSLNRDMKSISNTTNLGFGIKMGNKFEIGRAEFEFLYDNADFKSKQTPYQRKLSGPALGFNLLVDISDDVIRPYIGIGAGYAKLNTKRTGIQTPLFGEAKDKSNSYYIKPIIGLSFNIPGGSIFAELSYKIYNDAKFKGMYCTSPSNCHESTVSYDSFGIYNLAAGVALYF